MNAFLPKPIDLSQLEAVLRKFVAPENLAEVKKKKPAARRAKPRTDGDKTGGGGVSADNAGNADNIDNIDTADNGGGTENAAALVIRGVDTAKGLAFCGGLPEGYLEVLKIYTFGAAEQIAVMQKSLAENDITRLGIEAHSLKSSSRGIGADALADLSFEMEKACKADNAAYAAESLGALLKLYKKTADDISAAITGGKKKKTAKAGGGKSGAGPADKAALLEKVTAIAAAAEGYDIDGARALLDALLTENVGQDIAEGLAKIQTAVMQFSYDDTAAAARALMETLK
jgi:HPt (histidine-containing phosphotransfer) domain-containing protein